MLFINLLFFFFDLVIIKQVPCAQIHIFWSVTHHVFHLLWPLQLRLAFQPLHIVCLFFILGATCNSYFTVATPGGGAATGFSLSPLVFWSSSWAAGPFQHRLLRHRRRPPPPRRCPGRTYGSLKKRKKKKRQGGCARLAFEKKKIPWHVQEVGGLPFLQCFLLLNVAGRGSSLEETGVTNEITATGCGDNATWKLELPPSSWQPPHRRHCHPLRICYKTSGQVVNSVTVLVYSCLLICNILII